jgi:hypothetical protein
MGIGIRRSLSTCDAIVTEGVQSVGLSLRARARTLPACIRSAHRSTLTLSRARAQLAYHEVASAAMEGQVADSASTVVGLGMGAVEANPLLGALPGPAIGAVKLGTTYAVQRYADPITCASFSTVAGPAGYGAAAWNIGVLAGLGPIGALPALGAVALSHYTAEDPIWSCLPEDL